MIVNGMIAAYTAATRIEGYANSLVTAAPPQRLLSSRKITVQENKTV